MKSKSFNDLESIMETWDADVEWDVLSLQEIVGDDSMSEPNEVRTIRTKRGYVVLLSPPQPGAFMGGSLHCFFFLCAWRALAINGVVVGARSL